MLIFYVIIYFVIKVKAGASTYQRNKKFEEQEAQIVVHPDPSLSPYLKSSVQQAVFRAVECVEIKTAIQKEGIGNA